MSSNRGRCHAVRDEQTLYFLKMLSGLVKSSPFTHRDLRDFLNLSADAYSDLIRVKSMPRLKTLFTLTRLFEYDLSNSINYRYYYKELTAGDILKRIEYNGLTLYKLSKLTGLNLIYLRRALEDNKEVGQLPIFYTIEKFLDKLEKLKEIIS